ncbi:hypothetical protein [Maritimibacter dapengensis]|uniref:DUF8173 domain-containing protein n=1 Tax=Maritimibacter dapengensis TaxID=2836868 RepID=A0ABS6T2H0_9RHOB|nr:hypothetical protein [Maritimibacter dapengensis]MBV7378731.1 hypothetical protein [Maritimibacter dapengensis]
MFRQAILLFLLIIATPLAAQDGGSFAFGGDRFEAGRTVEISDETDGDLFAAGNRVALESAVEGSVHAAGRIVSVDGDVGGNVYAAGMDVELSGAVSGNASLAGDTVTVNEPVSGNIRAMGSTVTLTAPVAGSAILGGETVNIDAAISGDLAIGGEDIDWGEAAEVAGEVHVYAEEGDEPEIPARVAPADRVTFHDVSHWEDQMPDGFEDDEPRGFWARLGGLFGSVLVTGLLAFALAALAPGFMASIRERVLDQPGRSLWMGALGLAAVAGSTVVLAMTGIGIFIAPLAIFAAVALGFAGYVIGAYLLGAWLLTAVGQDAPDSTADRAIAAFVGAGLMTFVALIPFIGWLAVVAVLLIGIGGLVIRWFRPGFYTGA